jgi:AraC-like DNA-binding protein
MHEFYQRSLVRFIALLIGSLIAGYFCVDRSFLHAPLLPAPDAALPWRIVGNTDADRGGRSTIRIERDLERLRFAFTVSKAAEHPLAGAELHFVDRKGKPVHVDLSRYGSLGFYVRCAPANTLVFSAPTFDAGISQRGQLLTYRTPAAFFSCNENRSYVELDLSRLETPQWWFQMFKLDISRQAYRLDQVPLIGFSNTFQSPHEIAATVEISDLELRGRDYRYLVFLAALLVLAWSGFGVWFFRSHSRALIEDVKSKLQKDLPLVAYQQLTLEPHRDKEKAAVLGYIGAHYADPELNLDKVVEHTGVNRNKIGEMLKSELGFTFSGYLNKLRLTEAARLLADQDNAGVAEIAYSVGYGNVSYFNKLFKEEYGCTPKAFRGACASAASEAD